MLDYYMNACRGEVTLLTVYDLLRYAHIEFRDEKAAEEAIKVLTGKKIDQATIIVDFVGTKSKFVHKSDSTAVDLSQVDPCKLFVTCYPRSTTAEEIKAAFPTASEVEFLVNKKNSVPLG